MTLQQQHEDVVGDYLCDAEMGDPNGPPPSVQEIAEATGLPMNAVRKQLKRLRQNGDLDHRMRLLDQDGNNARAAGDPSGPATHDELIAMAIHLAILRAAAG